MPECFGGAGGAAARPRLTNPTAPRMPTSQPTPDCPQCSGPSDLSAVGCVPSKDRKTHPARRVVRIVPTIGSPVARSRTSTSAGWRERAPWARSTDARDWASPPTHPTHNNSGFLRSESTPPPAPQCVDRATTVGRSQGGQEHDPPPRKRGRVAPGEKDVDIIGLEMGQSTTIFEHEGWAGGTACPTKSSAPNCPRFSEKCRNSRYATKSRVYQRLMKRTVLTLTQPSQLRIFFESMFSSARLRVVSGCAAGARLSRLRALASGFIRKH